MEKTEPGFLVALGRGVGWLVYIPSRIYRSYDMYKRIARLHRLYSLPIRIEMPLVRILAIEDLGQ